MVDKQNELAIIVKKSGLDQTKAQYILERFQGYFQIAAEWERRAKEIIVTDEFQVVDMKIAREGRLFLKEKRVAIETARKELKEQSLREGKAIDGIANVLKALIVPLEEHLEKQEKFVELRAAAEMARLREERWGKEEAERIEAERKQEERNEWLRQENERLRRESEEHMKAENERLRKEAEKQERILAEERAKTELEHARIREANRKEREAAETAAREAREKANAERCAIEEKARKEREKAAKVLADQKTTADAARREQEAERARLQSEAAELQRKLAAMVECPICGHKFTPGEK